MHRAALTAIAGLLFATGCGDERSGDEAAGAVVGPYEAPGETRPEQPTPVDDLPFSQMCIGLQSKINKLVAQETPPKRLEFSGSEKRSDCRFIYRRAQVHAAFDGTGATVRPTVSVDVRIAGASSGVERLATHKILKSLKAHAGLLPQPLP